MSNKKQDLSQVIIFYIIIGLVGFFTYQFTPVENEILRFLIADLAMTVICFIFSLIKKNASMYDAYWSVIPFYFCLQWIYLFFQDLNMFHYLAFGVVSLWSWRLTLNWVRSWDEFLFFSCSKSFKDVSSSKLLRDSYFPNHDGFWGHASLILYNRKF